MRNDPTFLEFWRALDPHSIIAHILAERAQKPEGEATIKRLWEVILERARRDVDLRLPSRLHCNFVYIEAYLAALFRKIYWPKQARGLYAVRATGWWAQLDMNLVHCHELRQPDLSIELVENAIRACEQRAMKYWSGARLDPSWPEILVDGTVEILGELLEPVSTRRISTMVPGAERYETGEPAVFRSGDTFAAAVNVHCRDHSDPEPRIDVSGASSPEEAAKAVLDGAIAWAREQKGPEKAATPQERQC
jgi:hypothetical protein